VIAEGLPLGEPGSVKGVQLDVQQLGPEGARGSRFFLRRPMRAHRTLIHGAFSGLYPKSDPWIMNEGVVGESAALSRAGPATMGR
jgi:hypothetical protein